MRILSLTAAALLLLLMSGPALSAQDIRDALRLYDNSMFSRSRTLFDEAAEKSLSSDPEGRAVLSQVRSAVPGYETTMNAFIARNPHSLHVPQMKWYHAMNLFDMQDYKSAGEVLAEIELKQLFRRQRTEYHFRKAYCDLENRDFVSAKTHFSEVEKAPMSDYTAPSRYALGYICYVDRDFEEAIKWFDQSRKDGRFAQMSCY